MSEQKTVTIRHEVSYANSQEDVWVAITDPFALAEWFEPNDHQALVGHRFRFVVDESAKDCEVLKADAPRELVWSWQYVPNAKTGKPKQRGPMRISWTLLPDGEGTKLILEQFDAQNMGWIHRTLMRFGWKYMMKKLIPRVLGHVDKGQFVPGAIPLEKRLYKCTTVDEQYVR